MSEIKIINGQSLPNIPWQERPADLEEGAVLWRYTENPVMGRNPTPKIGRIFNSAVVPWQDGYIAVLRGEQVNGVPHVYLGRSKDGIHWNVDRERVQFVDENGEPWMPNYAYDPRLVKVEDTYYIIWCTDFHGAAIGMAKTKDFKHFTRMENPFIPYNRNAVLLPRKIGGMYKMLSRPSDSAHTPFGDIFLSESPDLIYWGRHRHVMSRGPMWWEAVKIGAGACPIETTEGWLMFFHGVASTCNGFVYSMGGAILDRDEPSKVLYRCENYLLTPEMPYEVSGFVPNVVFPCATVQDADTGRIAIYYGSADTCVGLAFGYVDEIVQYIKDKGKLIVGITEFEPMDYQDANGQWIGFDADMAKLVAEKLGVEPEYVESDWDSLFAGLDAGRFDIVCNGVEVTDERAKTYDFTTPYGYIHTALAVRKDNEDIKSFEDLKGKTTANSLASTYMELAESYGATVQGIDTLEETIQLLTAGRIDATLNADVSFYDYLNVHPDADFKLVAQTEDASHVAIPVRKGDDSASLLEAINTAIEELRADGTLKALGEKYFGQDISSED